MSVNMNGKQAKKIRKEIKKVAKQEASMIKEFNKQNPLTRIKLAIRLIRGKL